jgi:predicted DNA-binding ribbon-helix-helix protein
MDILFSKVVKHSVTIAGHTTSVSLEEPFWRILRAIAAEQSRAINDLVTEIDERRGTNLSSALRLYVLNYMLEKDLLQ